MIFLYPYPYKTFVVVVSGVVLLFVVMAVYMISRLIWERSDKRFKQYMNRILVVCGIAGGVFFFSGFALTMIKIHQVNQQLGFRYATPETPEGEPFILTKVESGGTLERAGFKLQDQILLPAVDDLYALLVNNQGGAVEIPVMREGEPMMIAVQVPEMELLAIKYWPFNKY